MIKDDDQGQINETPEMPEQCIKGNHHWGYFHAANETRCIHCDELSK